MPRMLRDHLCPQYEGTICARIRKDVISARIVWDDLCPKCKGLFVSEKLRNFCAYNIGFFLCLRRCFVYNFLFVVFCFVYFMCMCVSCQIFMVLFLWVLFIFSVSFLVFLDVFQ